jgi:hypothetical protein
LSALDVLHKAFHNDPLSFCPTGPFDLIVRLPDKELKDEIPLRHRVEAVLFADIVRRRDRVVTAARAGGPR